MRPIASLRAISRCCWHLPSGLRSTGLVEITLDNGVKGLGEGYIAVFAPRVFAAIVDLIAPIAVGRDIRDLDDIVDKLETATGYWSYQGAARHVVSAFEIALQDARAQCANVPIWKALGGTVPRTMEIYASGGDSISPDFMEGEIEAVGALGNSDLQDPGTQASGREGPLVSGAPRPRQGSPLRST